MEVDISSYTEVEDKVLENIIPSLNVFPEKKKQKQKQKQNKQKRKFYIKDLKT